MHENDCTESARPVNTNPLLVPGALYSREQILRLLGIGWQVLDWWEQAGLRALQPGTKSKYFLADDVIGMMVKLSGQSRKGKK